MGIIRFAIENPVKVAVAVILLVLFGMLSIFRIPIQLTPDVDRPLVTVSTFWEGASPQEIEREIVDRQEEKLKGVRNLKKMTSTSQEAMASVTLEFYVGTDTDAALQDVSEKLRQVTGYPEEMDEPTIEATGAEMSNTIAWIIFRGAPGEDVSDLKDFVEDDIKPILERAEGIARVEVYGGREREVKVIVDAYKLAARGLTFRDVEQALRRQNDNISAGTINQGKRDYTYRTVGQYEQVQDVESTVVAYRDGGPVFVRDVAEVQNTFKKQFAFVKSVGDYVLALPARKETGANVMGAMAELKKQIEYCNKAILHPQGRGLELTQVYDETVYITSAIKLVRNNLLIGGTLAVIVLLVFLRSGSATGIVAFSIPISVISTFLAVAALGRNLNVVMLAGMAFAVGMVVDNAIVVLENIDRHMAMGEEPQVAAYRGTGQHADHDGRLPAGGFRGGGSGPALPGHRHRHRLCGGAFPGGSQHGDPHSFGPGVEGLARAGRGRGAHRAPGRLRRPGRRGHQPQLDGPHCHPGGRVCCRQRPPDAADRLSAQREPQPGIRLRDYAAGLLAGYVPVHRPHD